MRFDRRGEGSGESQRAATGRGVGMRRSTLLGVGAELAAGKRRGNRVDSQKDAVRSPRGGVRRIAEGGNRSGSQDAPVNPSESR